MEIWKAIKGYEGYYSVSNYGRIRREEHTDSYGHTYKQRILSAKSTASRPYKRVHLSKDGELEWKSVHRMVAEAFVDNPRPDEYDIVNHLDNDPTNNCASNLEWTTYKGNMQHAAKQGRMKGQPANLAKAIESRKVPVIAIDKDGNEYEFPSQAEAARRLNIRSSHIAAACRKEYGYKQVGGYEFRYADSERQKNAIPNRIGMTKEEQREATRKRMLGNQCSKGRKPSEDNIRKIKEMNSIPVTQYDLNGNKIAEYPSCAEATKATGITHIDDASAGKRKTAGGYIWRRI